MLHPKEKMQMVVGRGCGVRVIVDISVCIIVDISVCWYKCMLGCYMPGDP